MEFSFHPNSLAFRIIALFWINKQAKNKTKNALLWHYRTKSYFFLSLRKSETQFLNIFIMDKSSFQSSKTENCVDKMSKQTLKAMFTCLHIHGYFLKGAVFHFCFKISVHVPKANYVNYCQEDAKATLTI